jgi:hypothetical protein
MERHKEKSGGRRIEPRCDKEQAERSLCKVGGGKQRESSPLSENSEKGVKCILDPYCELEHDPINCAAFVELPYTHQLAMAEARGHRNRCFNIIGAGCGTRRPCTWMWLNRSVGTGMCWAGTHGAVLACPCPGA